MEDDQLNKKREKAKDYVNQPERFSITSIELRMDSTHDLRLIEYRDGEWNCTCDFFRERGICSHIMAIQEILISKANLKLYHNKGRSK